MTTLYTGYFEVDFKIGSTTYNTYTNFGLVPLKKPVVSPPSITKDGQLTPGSNSWEFALTGGGETYETYYDILDALNGKRADVTIWYSAAFPKGTSDSSYTPAKQYKKEYKGSIKVSSFSTDDSYSTVTLDVELRTNDEITKALNNFLVKYALIFTTTAGTFDTSDFALSETIEHAKIRPEKIPVIDAPKPRTNYVTTPGANGALDLSEVLSGGNGVYYDNPEGEWGWVIEDEFFDEAEDIFKLVVNTLNGIKATVQTKHGLGDSYNGRFTVSGLDISEDKASFRIGYVIDPWMEAVTPQGATNFIIAPFPTLTKIKGHESNGGTEGSGYHFYKAWSGGDQLAMYMDVSNHIPNEILTNPDYVIKMSGTLRTDGNYMTVTFQMYIGDEAPASDNDYVNVVSEYVNSTSVSYNVTKTIESINPTLTADGKIYIRLIHGSEQSAFTAHFYINSFEVCPAEDE